MSDATQIMEAVALGDTEAADQLLELVYEELRRLAHFQMGRVPGQTLQPTALVHEAWLRLVGSKTPMFKDRRHFFFAAAEAMRHILVDKARQKNAARHGGKLKRADLDEIELAAPGPNEQLLAVHDSLDRFTLKYPEHANVVKLRYFAGMTNEEVAQLLGISVSTVKNYWSFSRAWLFKEIEGK